MSSELIDDGSTKKGEDDVGYGIDAVEEIKFHGVILGISAGAHVILELLM